MIKKEELLESLEFSRDITEAEEEIKSLAKFPEENPNPVVRIDYHGKILYCNNAYKRVFKENDRITNKLKEAVKKIAKEKISIIEDIEIETDGRIFLISLTPIEEENYMNLYGIDITNRRKAEKELNLISERLTLAQKSAGAGVWDWDIRTEILNWSPELYILFGLDPKKDTATFDTWLEMLHPDDRQRARVKINESIKEHRPISDEHRIVLPSGRTRWINVLGNTIYDEHGEAVRVAGIYIDITDRKKIQEALESSESRYHNLFENMLEGYAYCRMFYDKDGRPYDWVYLDVNRKFELLTGLKDVIGKRITEIMPEVRDINPELLELYSRVALTGQPESIKDYIESLKIWLHISVFSPKKEHFITVFNNVTEIYESKDKAIASEKKYRTLFETSGEGILITEIETQKFKYANPAICQMLGYAEKELTKMSIADIHPKENSQRFLAKFEGQISGNYSLITDIPCLRKDGTIFYADINTAIITIDGQKCTAGFFHDTTERKKTEKEILYLSYHDQLTGLYNRRFLEEELKRLNTKRQLPISIIMADVDGLKYVNDCFGHEEGDRLLIEASKIIKNSCRKEDIITRWGGDEFIIFLPKTSERDARDVIDRIREASKIQKFDDKINISISLGLETNNKLNENIDFIIEQADKNMYADKARLKKS